MEYNISDILFNNTFGVNDNFTIVQNLSSGPHAYTPFSERPETYIVPVVFALIFVAGVLGNGTLVIVFLRHRAMRNIPNTYILSLALADLLVIVSTVPFTSMTYTMESWPWGEAVCRISECAKDISIGVSVFTLTALSADRYCAIVNPLRKLHAAGGGRYSTKSTVAAATVIWAISAGCSMPGLIGSHIRIFKSPVHEIRVCYPFPQEWGDGYPRAVVLARFLVYYAIPLTVIGCFYALMARHLVQSARNVPGEIHGAQRQILARRKVAITVLAFVAAFAVCFLPYHVFMMWFYYTPTAKSDYNAFWHHFRILGFCLSFMNSCVNPMALYCVSGAFRKYFNRYLLCRGSAKGKKTGTELVQRATTMSLTASRRNQSTSLYRFPITMIRR
ncbi:neuropeptide CCHamide-1 receptor [Ctenocephalides felis]|uniref:neuropeptide CCHamide-1 receptor n=1 Tax=Ctenocephalides felis TaxID=7515 RepID=UPI000E6E2D67|nr:neuropeptide CCHamide-1 receptor [Ctenocephalides felis]